MKKLTIFLSIVLVFGFLLLLGGCQGGVVVPSTPTPTPPPSTGSISGIVTEKGTGTPLSGVTITVDGTTTLTTGSDGSYTITNLSPGFHTLKFEKVGYKTATANVNVTAGTNTPKAVELENTTKTEDFPIYGDSYIYQGGSPQGNNSTIGFGAIVAGADARMLFRFPSLSQDEKIISAKLKLYKVRSIPISGSPVPYAVYPIKEDWNESAVTWAVRTFGFLWFTAGGSYDDAFKISEGQFTLGGLLSWEEIDVTEAFNYWQQAHDNYGIIIVSKQSTTSVFSFASSDHSNSAFRPYVEVKYYNP